MIYKKISELVPHPKNEYYFDDITNEKWYDLLESIRLNGIYTPVVIASPIEKNSDNKMIIVSGHQRVRACKELGIEKIQCVIENFKSEDAMLLALIETNLFQRGSGNTNPIKLGRCLNELDRIYGVKRGNNQHRNPNNLDSMVERKSKKEIAGRLGLSQETLTNYQKLTTLDEELQQMVLDGGISVTNAVKVAKKIPKEKQKDIVEHIRKYGKISSKETDELIKRLKEGDKNTSAQELKTATFVDKEIKIEHSAITKIMTDIENLKDDNSNNSYDSALKALKSIEKRMGEFVKISDKLHDIAEHIYKSSKEIENILNGYNSLKELETELRNNVLFENAMNLLQLSKSSCVIAHHVSKVKEFLEKTKQV